MELPDSKNRVYSMNFVRQFQENDESLWEEFVDHSNNGTLFHYRKFLVYHSPDRFKDHSLLFYTGDKLSAVLTGVERDEAGKKVFFSHPGASYGGFVFKSSSFTRADSWIENFDTYLQQNNFDQAILVQPPRIYGTLEDETLEYALLWRGFEVSEHYISSVIPLNGTEREIAQRVYKQKNRSEKFYSNLMNKSGLTFKWENDFKKFYPILAENKARYDSKPTHTLDELHRLNSLFPDRLKLLLLIKDGQPIGGTLNFIANKNTVIIFYNMMDYEFSKLQPATLQVLETIRWASNAGFKYLDFGVSQDPRAENPLTPQPSLIRFKEEFASFGLVRKVYQKNYSTI